MKDILKCLVLILTVPLIYACGPQALVLDDLDLQNATFTFVESGEKADWADRFTTATLTVYPEGQCPQCRPLICDQGRCSGLLFAQDDAALASQGSALRASGYPRYGSLEQPVVVTTIAVVGSMVLLAKPVIIGTGATAIGVTLLIKKDDLADLLDQAGDLVEEQVERVKFNLAVIWFLQRALYQAVGIELPFSEPSSPSRQQIQEAADVLKSVNVNVPDDAFDTTGVDEQTANAMRDIRTRRGGCTYLQDMDALFIPNNLFYCFDEAAVSAGQVNFSTSFVWVPHDKPYLIIRNLGNQPIHVSFKGDSLEALSAVQGLDLAPRAVVTIPFHPAVFDALIRYGIDNLLATGRVGNVKALCSTLGQTDLAVVYTAPSANILLEYVETFGWYVP